MSHWGSLKKPLHEKSLDMKSAPYGMDSNHPDIASSPWKHSLVLQVTGEV